MKIQINFSDRQKEMIEMLKHETGVYTVSGVISTALNDMFRSYFPAYKTGTIAGSKENIIKKIEMKKEQKKIEEEMNKTQEKAQFEKVCRENFYGEVGEDGDCYYTSYGMTPEEDTKESIGIWSCVAERADDYVFIPSREGILKNRADLRKKFKVKK